MFFPIDVQKKLQLDELEDCDEKSINDLLEPTDLLEETFYAAHSKQSPIVKSFGLCKGSFSRVHSQKSSLMMDEDADIVLNQSTSSLESYKNGTLVNHVPLAITQRSVSGSPYHKSPSNHDLAQNIINYKLITDAIEKHLHSPNSVFCALLAMFTKYFLTKYQTVIDGYKNGTISPGEIHTSIESAVSDLQHFIRILCESINLFYKLDKLMIGKMGFGENMFNRDNVINFITTLVFTEPLYNQIFELLRINDADTEKAFQEKLLNCAKLAPQDMGIQPEFCLFIICLAEIRVHELVQLHLSNKEQLKSSNCWHLRTFDNIQRENGFAICVVN